MKDIEEEVEMKKKMLRLAGMFAVMLILCFGTTLSAQAKTKTLYRHKAGKHVTMTLSSNGTLNITGSGRMYNYTDDTVGFSRYLKKVKKVVIGKNVTYVSGNMISAMWNVESFSVKKGNKYYKTKNGALYNKKMTRLIQYPAKKAGSTFRIPKTVKTIDAWAFGYCSNLKTVYCPRGARFMRFAMEGSYFLLVGY